MCARCNFCIGLRLPSNFNYSPHRLRTSSLYIHRGLSSFTLIWKRCIFFFQSCLRCIKDLNCKKRAILVRNLVTNPDIGVSQTNNGASRASFHVTAGKMQHTVRNGAAHTASHLGPSTVGPRRLAFSFCRLRQE